METPKIFESEYRFCLILWETEPINSTELAKLCKQRLGWSKATTYTVLRRLAERRVLKNENATVAFLAAFTKRQKLSESDAAALRRLIDGWTEGDGK